MKLEKAVAWKPVSGKKRRTTFDAHLPTGLSDARNKALVGQLPEADPADAELAIHGPGPSAEHAPMHHPRGELRRTLRGRDFRLARHTRFQCRRPERAVLVRSKPCRYAAAPPSSPSFLSGTPIARRNSRASSSVRAVVTSVMFMPCGRVNLSGLISGNTICSESPRL